MVIRRSHWIKAGAVAIVLHAAVLIGLKSQSPGEASPPQGPKIALTASIPGVMGSVSSATQSEAAEPIEEVRKPDKTAVVKSAEPDQTSLARPSEPDKAAVLKPADPEQPAVLQPAELENQKIEPTRTEPERQETKPTVKKKTTPTKKKKQQSKKTQKKKKKQSRASKRGNSRKGSAGAKRGGGGKSKASAGAVNRYASRVRARILSRRPGSGGRRGTAVIAFQVSTSGGLSWARISRSSGSGALDQKALGSVRRASPFPRPPAGSRASQLRFSISFRFQ